LRLQKWVWGILGFYKCVFVWERIFTKMCVRGEGRDAMKGLQQFWLVKT
jgi:hypothetical protein